MKSRRNMVLAISFAIGAMLAARCAVPPSITAINAEQLDDRTARITYKLVNGPAVVTMEALTNGQNGAWGTLSGTEMTSLAGDVNRLVSGGTDDTVREIRWQPGVAFSQSKISYESIRFSLKAWATNDPPPYMVVSLAKVAEPRTMYYASTNDMPGGLLSNRRYRTDAIVMRKIPAKGVTWWMGSTNETTWVENVNREVRHKVTLAENYYIGVFPITQRQWANVMLTQVSDAATYHAWHSGGGYGDMRAMEWLSFYELREDSVKSYANGQWAGAKNTDYQYPNPPNPNSFLGKLRNRTGIDFDLPSEAQWEYACRAGHGTGYWGDGSVLNANNPANLARIACFKRASDTDAEDADPAVGGTPIVGSCAPNYFEGMLSIDRFRVPDAGRNIRKIWDEVPANVGKYQVGPAYRLPLWELVFHECVCAQWYWGDYSNKLPSIWKRRDLFNVLYGTMPMFMFDKSIWARERERFAASYARTSPVARATGYSEMVAHRILSQDRMVQSSEFADGTVVTVNFGKAPFTLADGTSIPAEDSIVRQVPKTGAKEG